MTVFSGFFNSVEGDRKYNAEHFSKFFDGLICDGVYTNVGDAFHVSPGSGIRVVVGTGRAWFKRVWVVNDAALPIDLDTPDPQLPRIDAIVIDVDTSTSGRTASIHVVKGTAHVSPSKPTLIDTDTNTQYPLAYITVLAGATAFSTANIEDCQLTGELPCVEALLNLSSYHLEQINQRFTRDENPAYNEAVSLADPVSGEPMTTFMGKIKKLVTTLFAARSNTGVNKFLRHDLTYAEPPLATNSAAGYMPHLESYSSGDYKYLRQDGNWAVPPNTQNNNAVSQTITSGNANYRVLLSATADNTTRTEGALKDGDFTYNPSTNNLSVGTVNNVKLAKSGSSYGYYDGSTFKTFRQPTGNAAAAQVLSGYTFANASSDSVTGSMTNRGAVSSTIAPGDSYTIPAGYHNGSGVVSASCATWTQTFSVVLALYVSSNNRTYGGHYKLPAANLTSVTFTLDSSYPWSVCGFHGTSYDVLLDYSKTGSWTFNNSFSFNQYDLFELIMNKESTTTTPCNATITVSATYREKKY